MMCQLGLEEEEEEEEEEKNENLSNVFLFFLFFYKKTQTAINESDGFTQLKKSNFIVEI